MSYTLWNEECLEAMKRIPDGSVDMVMCDLPYGTTQNKWDSVIDLPSLWSAYRRVCKPSAAIVLTAAQPFTSVLVCSNLKDFRYSQVWHKSRPTGFLDAKRKPLTDHEDVLLFSSERVTFNPQMRQGAPSHSGKSSTRKATTNYASFTPADHASNGGIQLPRTVIPVSSLAPNGSVHPTQKPVALMEYLIKTYTHPGDTVLDNCMGSGTTGVACMNLGRRFIGIEKDVEHGYFQIAEKRIAEAAAKQEDWI